MGRAPQSSLSDKHGLSVIIAFILTCVLLISTLSTALATDFTKISTNSGNNSYLSMSADGTVITFEEPARIAISINGGAPISASSGLNNTHSPYLPPSGSWLAYFATGIFPNSGVYKYNVTTTAKTVAFQTNLQCKPAFDNAGNLIAYQTNTDGKYYIKGIYTGITASPVTNGTKPVCDGSGAYVAFRANGVTYVFDTTNPGAAKYSKSGSVGTNDDVPAVVMVPPTSGNPNWMSCQTSNASNIRRYKLEDGTGGTDYVGATMPVAYSADGRFLAAKSASSNDILIFNTSTRAIVGTVTGGPTPTEIAIASGGGKISFVTTAQLVAGDTGTNKDVYVWNNVAPIATGQNVTTDEDTTSASFTLDVVHPIAEGQALTYTLVSGPSKGTISFALNNYVQTGDTAPSMTYTPSLNLNGSDSFTYTVTDPLGGTSTATVSITINPVNDAPTFVVADTLSFDEDTVGTIIVTVNDVDGDPLTVSGTSNKQDKIMDANIVAGGSGADRTLSLTPEPDANGTVTIAVTVSDGLIPVTKNVAVTINPVNDPPTVGVSNASTNEDTPVTVDVTVGDIDSSLSNTSMIVTASSGDQSKVKDANIVEFGNGPTRYLTITPEPDANGDVTITVTANDGLLSTSKDFVLTINPVNDGPTIAPIADTSTNYNIPKTVDVTVNDIDSPIDGLVVTATSSDQAIIKDSSLIVTGTGNTRSLEMTPELINPGGDATITVTVMDDYGVKATTQFKLTVFVYKPDLSVRESSVPDFIGEGIINLDGTGQTVGTTVDNTVAATYYITVKNSGFSADKFVINAPAPTPGWAVAYKNVTAGGTNITSPITHAGWATPLLAVDASLIIQVTVTPGATAVGNTTLELPIIASSVAFAAQQDVVKIRTTVTAKRLVDLSLRPYTIATYSGVGVYNLDGTDQTVGLSVKNGSKAIYYLHIQNKGNAPDTFLITGPAAPAGWTLEYKYYSTGEIITSAVTHAGYTTPVVNPGAVVTVSVSVIPGTSVIPGSSATQTITITSNGDATKQDVGVINTDVPIINLLDVSLRPSTTSTYTGVGIYNLDGTDQTVTQAVLNGHTGIYYVHIQNKGNVPDTYVVTTGPALPAGWTAIYKDYTAGVDITADINGAGWTSPVVNPGKYLMLAVYIKPDYTVSGGLVEQMLTATSSNNSSIQDVGVMQTVN